MKIKGSYLLALLMALAIAGWMLSGELVVGGQADRDPPSADTPKVAGDPGAGRPDTPFRVQVATLKTTQRVAQLVLQGRTEAEARVEVKAETPGLVEALPFAKGAKVEAGEIVCRIEPGAREVKVAQAKAKLAQAELEASAANTLSKKGFAAETRVRALQAALDAAKAEVAEAELDLKRTEMRAPFTGVIEKENAELGAYLNHGAPCVTLTAPDPMLVVGQVSERDVANLAEGMTGTAKLVTGESVEGTIRFISPSADAATRTFKVELEVPNPDGKLRDGVTAQMHVGLEPVEAHNMPSNYLTLDDEGRVGVRTVDENNIVRFLPAEIIGDSETGLWLTGLPDEVTVITVGQDYVSAGQKVEPVRQTADTAR